MVRVLFYVLWFFFQAGGPSMTAFDINDRGNRVYLKFEPHAPTFFPVNETRLDSI